MELWGLKGFVDLAAAGPRGDVTYLHSPPWQGAVFAFAGIWPSLPEDGARKLTKSPMLS